MVIGGAVYESRSAIYESIENLKSVPKACVPFMRSAKAMVSLHIFAGSPEPSTHGNAISTILSCAGSNGDLSATHAGSESTGESHLYDITLDNKTFFSCAGSNDELCICELRKLWRR